MKLDWMPVSEPYDEADGALMPGRVAKHGVIARIGHRDVFFEIWPSEPPEHIEDRATLTLTVDGVVVEEIGRFESGEAAVVAAQRYFGEHGARLANMF